MDKVLWDKNVWQCPYPQGGYKKHKYLAKHKVEYSKFYEKVQKERLHAAGGPRKSCTKDLNNLSQILNFGTLTQTKL